MSKIQEMSIDRILNSTGPNLANADFNVVFKNNQEILDRLKRLMKRVNNMEDISDNDKIGKIEDFFRENEAYVDKESLVVLTVYNTQRSIDESKVDKLREKELRRYVSNGIRLLDGENITVYTVSRKSVRGGYNRLDVINSKLLVECIKSRVPVSTLTEPSSKEREMF